MRGPDDLLSLRAPCAPGRSRERARRYPGRSQTLGFARFQHRVTRGGRRTEVGAEVGQAGKAPRRWDLGRLVDDHHHPMATGRHRTGRTERERSFCVDGGNSFDGQHGSRTFRGVAKSRREALESYHADRSLRLSWSLTPPPVPPRRRPSSSAPDSPVPRPPPRPRRPPPARPPRPRSPPPAAGSPSAAARASRRACRRPTCRG